jgi:hypothetical protein
MIENVVLVLLGFAFDIGLAAVYGLKFYLYAYWSCWRGSSRCVNDSKSRRRRPPLTFC